MFATALLTIDIIARAGLFCKQMFAKQLQEHLFCGTILSRTNVSEVYRNDMPFQIKTPPLVA
jgi:hypothetical protein